MSAATSAPHDGLRLYISPDVYAFEPAGENASEKSGALLILNRKSGEVSTKPSLDGLLTARERTMDIYGILGLLKLSTTEFLIVITSRSRVATLFGKPIYLATDFRVLPISSSVKSNLLSNPVEKALLAMLKTHLYSAPFYFSYGVDLTNSFQRQSVHPVASDLSKPLWERADERFFWNRHLNARLIEAAQSNAQVSPFILPCMYGFLAIKSATINGKDFVFGLLARRSRHRAGTRYFSRGIDADGHVSNFNESEQFVVYDGQGGAVTGSEFEKDKTAFGGGRVEGKIRMSYVQTRGSVPVFWAEVNNLRYKPDLLIMDKPDTAAATRKHFEEQTSIYGTNYLANLVNQKGYEKPVKEAYEAALEELANDKVIYTYFDFHHECKGMKFERVMGLVNTLEQKGLSQDNFFHYDSSAGSKVVRTQDAVLRTNCMDCLDRTNVVQSTLGRWVLNKQLTLLGILKEGEGVERETEFMRIFRNIWADHADVVSKAYSGTGALKTDFTRTGKRSKEGALQDGINSITRYIKNNYFDGARQDAYDLFTGAWSADAGKVPHVDARAVVVRSMPLVLAFSLIMFICSLVVPRRKEAISGTKLATFWIVVASFALWYIVDRGLEYVAWPTLNRPNEVMYYDGPGYSSGRYGRGAVTGHWGVASNKPTRTPSKAKITQNNKGRRGAAYQANGSSP
ncbi:Phosphoinositide phosphatase sac1 [Tilletia horrida]|uniref:Phosphoinositide phosphatase sac1 n=1 Tax=Tilletia horrida TaxID=155126 RepID=A0AAN6JSV3_9BASI|nr:Phosphoinositide phosphatase sac1 [Tilletia horrida]KAK0537074.1 Phosphoinositide phosphatase sac1 [Tilletia horrida]KAK0538196.1 Phosphoinositide phosphatase sac1 [Tilletia horrida]KAK0560558.1 Phosphoinositide phosphatase sac1 [Tilletia horrida]